MSRISQRQSREDSSLAAAFLTPGWALGQPRRKKVASASWNPVIPPAVWAATSRAHPSVFLAKRFLDILVSAVGLVLTSPLFLFIAALVKLDSRGPALYRAPRLGKNGKSFICLKFRTMVNNAEASKAVLRARNERDRAFFKIARDPRITRLGTFLRRYSLDELPQLWNVLRGEMSMVGPRPHPVDDSQFYAKQDFRRLAITPGITGLWQVTARRDPSFERNVALDVEYIKSWTLTMDLRILLKTIFVVLQGTGS